MSSTKTSFTNYTYQTELFGVPFPPGNLTNQTLLNFTTNVITDANEDEEPSLAIVIFSYILIVLLGGFLICCFCAFFIMFLTECLDIKSCKWKSNQESYPFYYDGYSSSDSYSVGEQESTNYTTVEVTEYYTLQATSNKDNIWEPGAKKLIAETPIDEIVLRPEDDNIEWAKITCSICLEEIDFSPDAEKKTTQLSCGHIYHQDCISNWYFGGVTSVSRCPLCREEMKNVVIQIDSI